MWRNIISGMGKNCCTLCSWPVDLPAFCFKYVSNAGSRRRNFRIVLVYSWKVKKNSTVCIRSPNYSSFGPGFTCVWLHESPCSQGKRYNQLQDTNSFVWLFVLSNVLLLFFFLFVLASELIRISLHRSIWFGLENHIFFEQHTVNILVQS